MNRSTSSVAGSQAKLARWGRAAAVAVLVVAALNALGWATGVWRIFPSWPRSTLWTSLWLTGLAAATLVQSGTPSRSRIWVGRSVAAVVGVLAAGVLVEHLAAKPFGLDHTLSALITQSSRPSPRSAASIFYLSAAVGLIRVDRRRTAAVSGLLLLTALATPLVTIVGHVFRALSAVRLSESTGQAVSTAIGVLLLAAATVAARPDRNPVAWLLARPDRWSLLRLFGVLCGLPLLVAVSRLPFLMLGLGTEAAWILAIMIATVMTGGVAFYVSQREQRLLIDRALLSRQRADAEMRYRILAENAVDVVVRLRGGKITWVSPSVEAAFGEPAARWIGEDFSLRIHPEDRDGAAAAVSGMGSGQTVLARFRVRNSTGGYHWVDGHAKPYVDMDGNTDGLIAALRIVDDQVEAQEKLDRLARFDNLTGLPNRAEAFGRLESALENPRTPGAHLGVLFCDVDHFKEINDTWGHGAGDAVLSTLAARIRENVRQGDTVGRVGGDEMVVLLPGVHSLDEATQIGEMIRRRATEPIHYAGNVIHATLSIGVTISVPGESATAVTARADAAMYQAKSGNRNAVSAVEPT